MTVSDKYCKEYNMRSYDNYIFALTCLLLGASVLYSLLDEDRFFVCYNVHLILCLITNWLSISMSLKAKKKINRLNGLLIMGFILLFVSDLIEIVSKNTLVDLIRNLAGEVLLKLNLRMGQIVFNYTFSLNIRVILDRLQLKQLY